MLLDISPTLVDNSLSKFHPCNLKSKHPSKHQNKKINKKTHPSKTSKQKNHQKKNPSKHQNKKINKKKQKKQKKQKQKSKHPLIFMAREFLHISKIKEVIGCHAL